MPINVINGTGDADFLQGTDGDDAIFGDAGDDVLDAGSGNDILDADGDNDFLYGGPGDDFLDAGDGNDVLDGGTGDDNLIGGIGDDTFVFGMNYGADVASDAGGDDRVEFGEGVMPSGVSVSRVGNDVVIALNGTGDRLTLSEWFSPESRIESLVFADGTVVDSTGIELALGNQAPVAAADSAEVSEDATSPVTGNVLANDGDSTAPDGLAVTNAGTYQGLYGTLDLAADGSYTYMLNSSLPEVQALAQGETLTDSFSYDVTDGVALNPLGASAQLNIAIQGANEAPVGHGQTIIGTKRDDYLVGTPGDDIIDGRRGSDTMVGGKGDDTYFVDHHHKHEHKHHRGDQVVEGVNEGHDTVYSKVSYTLPTNVEDLHLLGSKNIDGTGNSAANWIEGNRGNNDLAGGAGDDLLQGGKGKDRLQGGDGIDILQGGKGKDKLEDKSGSTVFDGGRGDDEMTGGRSADFFAGGRGDDEIELGGGNDVIAFNKGDGVDRIEGERQNGVLSLGGGIRYEDLRFRKDGKDLVLETGGSDRLVFEDWYKGKQSVVTLQVVAEAMQGFSQDSSDRLRNDKIELFNFRELVDAFDDARSSRKNMDSWKLMNELLDAHLCGSDDSALGGDLAYRYGMTGALAGMSWDAAQGTVAAAGFGVQKQTLLPIAQLPDDSVKLGS